MHICRQSEAYISLGIQGGRELVWLESEGVGWLGSCFRSFWRLTRPNLNHIDVVLLQVCCRALKNEEGYVRRVSIETSHDLTSHLCHTS